AGVGHHGERDVVVAAYDGERRLGELAVAVYAVEVARGLLDRGDALGRREVEERQVLGREGAPAAPRDDVGHDRNVGHRVEHALVVLVAQLEGARPVVVAVDQQTGRGAALLRVPRPADRLGGVVASRPG